MFFLLLWARGEFGLWLEAEGASFKLGPDWVSVTSLPSMLPTRQCSQQMPLTSAAHTLKPSGFRIHRQAIASKLHMHARRKHIYWNASSVLEAFLYTTLLKYICKQWVGLELRSTRWISRLHRKSWKTRHCSWFKLQSHRDFYVTFSLCIWGQQKNDTVDWNSSLSLSL